MTWIVDGMAETETVPWGAVPSHPIPVKPADPVYSYTFAGWSPAIVPVSGDAVYTAVFSKHPYPNSPFNPFSPNKPVSALPGPKPESASQPVPPAIPALPFADVDPGSELGDIVGYVYENGIMNGVSETLFDPYGTLTRGMEVTILYRLEGEPEAAYCGTFMDVPAGEWFTDGVEWAASKGIVNGYGNGKFGPTDEVTREQLAAILYRYAGFKGYDVIIDENTNYLSYTDVFDIAEYARLPMFWAIENDMILDTNGDLRHAEPALRWEVAAAIRGFCENVGK